MFSRRKEIKSQAGSSEVGSHGDKKQRHLRQMGLLDVPDIGNLGNLSGMLSGSGVSDDDEDDDNEDLEAELLALQAGEDTRRVLSRRRLEESVLTKPKQEVVSEMDDDEDFDENDPELLSELNSINQTSRPAPTRPCPAVPQRSSHEATRPLVTAASGPISSVNHQPPAKKISPAPTQQVQKPLITSVNQSAPTQQVQKPLITSVNKSAPPENSEKQSLVALLQERILNYKSAQENAKAAGESAKIRRLERGLKTLEGMLKNAKAGKSVVEEDIPPTVALGAKPNTELSENVAIPPNSTISVAEPVTRTLNLPTSKPSVESENPTTITPPPLPPRMKSSSLSAQPVSYHEAKSSIAGDSNVTLEILTTRRNQYRQAAVSAKRENKDAKALEYVKIVKKFDLVIAALEKGQEVDLQAMPPPPPGMDDNRHTSTSHIQVSPSVVGGGTTRSVPSALQNPTARANAESQHNEPPATDGEPEDPSLFKAPPPPMSVLDALQQRLEKYKSTFEEASNSDNSSKARRMGRIVKQYEDAIKLFKAGKQVPYDDLPTPPGFAPIPLENISSKVPQPMIKPVVPGAHAVAKPLPSAVSQSTPPPPQQVPSSGGTPVSGGAQMSNKPIQKAPPSLHEKQLAAILERQKLFKTAALEAKKRNDLQAAKEYLRLAKGFEPMINASKCGLPVNMDSLPLPPQLNENSFEIVNLDDCIPMGDNEELYDKLERELQAQIEMCSKNRMHFSKLGDVQNTQKFETMLQNTKKDLDFVRHGKKRGDPLPRFHYETRTFSIVKCCTDLGDDDLELTIIKGINYTCSNPEDVDTYVKFEFPFPSETTPKDKTRTIRDTNNPEYNAVFKLAISRKSRSCVNIIKRKGIKLEAWAKGGFLRSDVLLGTAVVKLQPLETRCILHDSFDLLDGRKPTGGKLEIKVRIREPILTKQIETHCEKWLIVNGSKTTKI